MSVITELGLGGYIHHQIPRFTPDEVTAKLANEAKRRSPGIVFRAVVPSPSPTTPSAEPIRVQLSPTLTS